MFDSLTTVSLPYLLALFALSAQWLWTVWQRSRVGLRPRLAYLAAPGLAALIAAPLTQAEPLFGFGAALLLIAAYAGSAYIPASARHARRVRSVGTNLVLTLLLLGAALLAVRVPQPLWPAVWPLWAMLLLAALAWVLGAGVLGAGVLGAGKSSTAPPSAPGFLLRLGPTTVPAWPDLELRFDGAQARVQNIGSTQLYLAGWSPSGENSWMRPRDAHGQPLVVLGRGQVATLAPWPGHRNGVRVWYVRQNAPAEALVFRADWTRPDHPRRVLN